VLGFIEVRVWLQGTLILPQKTVIEVKLLFKENIQQTQIHRASGVWGLGLIALLNIVFDDYLVLHGTKKI